MPGIGKTTLAKEVYKRTVYHFHVCAWVCIYEVYEKRVLLLEILSHFIPITGYILEMNCEDLEIKLYQILKMRRYLIVFDNMWDPHIWDDLRLPFPNDKNGSRILITSRLFDVAWQAKVHTDPYPLRLLSYAESWHLLQMKIFHEERCPADLVDVGLQIAKSCKGLPLAIVAMAGLLERMDRQQKKWKEIAQDLNSQISEDPQENCKKILELSYKHLPDHLKACFLYFGAFPDHKHIPVPKLIRLWIAEGFVQKTQMKALEDLAEDYLMDLIGRSLVSFTEKESRFGVKACKVPDVLHSLCLSKAKEENFLQVITKSKDHSDAFTDLDYGVDFSYSYPSHSATYEYHRLCICSKRKHFVMSRPSGPYVRALLFFAIDDMYPHCPYDLSFLSDNFKLLKVLDLECINLGSSFPNWIDLLVHLRYLAASGDFDSVPSSIANLWNLETFIVKGLRATVNLPDTIWLLAKLRHVHVNGRAIFSLQDDLRNYSQLDNLITLSSPCLHYGENSHMILRQFPNLRKLRSIILESWDDSQNCNQFPDFKVLDRLESLKMYYHGRVLCPGEFNFPANLKKLTLSKFCLPWSHISVVGQLPNLEVLKLLSRAFDGDIWDMVEGEFFKLKFLKLDSLSIAIWNANSDHLPNLQNLVLRRCTRLLDVPSSFAEIPALQTIEVQWCTYSVEESVRNIMEGVEGLKVHINLANSHY